ncbi:MAG TPA: phosphatase PAP2 family protein [Candidatus Thermoplasmatota archaeon]|nr:phosphatase PAP2 family protein [Candidatus Thermoplasmatota archaeon]
MDLRDRRLAFAMLLASCVVFGLVLADVLYAGAGTRFDARLETALAAAWPIDARVGVGAALSFPGDVFAVVAVTGGVAVWSWSARRRGDAALLVAATLVLSGVVASAKHVVARDRPLEGFDTLAFPSGHAARAVLVYGLALSLAHVVRGPDRARAVGFVTAFALVALVTGAGRVVRGAHWATDVVAGWAIGGAMLAVALLMRPVFARLDTRRT